MSKKTTNHWLKYHTCLGDPAKKKAREAVEAACEWSTDTFYRKMRSPQKLKNWEKYAVAKAYRKEVTDFFTETDKVPII